MERYFLKITWYINIIQCRSILYWRENNHVSFHTRFYFFLGTCLELSKEKLCHNNSSPWRHRPGNVLSSWWEKFSDCKLPCKLFIGIILFVFFYVNVVHIVSAATYFFLFQCGLDKIVKQWGISEECTINEEPINTILGKVKWS